MSSVNKGFTMVEALASMVLVGVGIYATLGGLSALTAAEANGRDREHMERFAMEKFDELIATNETTNGETGDFADRGEADLVWDSQVTPSGVENLNHISITVKRRNDQSSPVAEFDSLVYVQPTTTTGAAQ